MDSCARTKPGVATIQPGSGQCSVWSCGCAAGPIPALATTRGLPSMCGIAGFAYMDPSHPVDRELLGRMTTVMRHRGPDADGFHLGPGVCLGLRRLSIIDVAGGDQPIYGEDRTCAVILNGEIYNFQELQRELSACGHVFKTRSDTESIVHAYEEWGLDCVARLHGMFAFVIWDERRRRLVLARDRAGKKPLYYHADGERLVFASEIKALLQDGSLKRRISPEGLSDYFTFGTIPAPGTIFQDIQQIPPGRPHPARRRRPSPPSSTKP